MLPFGRLVLSGRAFVLLWAALTAMTLGYAFLDLWLSPSLRAETSFSMTPDLSQIWEIRHWGGRLARERAWALLVCNALVLGGVATLAGHGLVRLFSRKREPEPELADCPDSVDVVRTSVFPAHAPSAPP
jgi:hypothetical protein